MSAPLVSIGLPVYNGARTLTAALDSLLAQTCQEFEIVISDNASTDDTAAICAAYAAKHPRIRYFRQPRNIGASGNFRSVREACTGRYFMWAAADDRRSPDFLEVNLRFLEANPDYVGSCSPVRFEGDVFNPHRMGDLPLRGERAERILGAIAVHANARYYSLFRREALLDCPIAGQHFLAWDWAVMLHAASAGRLNRCEEGHTIFGIGGDSWQRNLYSSHRNRWIDFWLPYLTFARYAWSQRAGFRPGQKLKLAGKLVWLNAYGFLAQGIVAVRGM